MICQRVAIINQGRIVAVDTPAQLRQRLRGTQVIRVELRGDPAAIEPALRELPGVARVGVLSRQDGVTAWEVEGAHGADVREAIFRLAVERQWMLRELTSLRASLEDVFIHLTTQEGV